MTTASPQPKPPGWSVPVVLRESAEWSWRLLVVAAAVGGLIYAGAQLSFIVVPIIVAAMASALLELIRRPLLLLGVKGAWASMGAFVLGVLFITSAMVLAVSEFYGNFDQLSEQSVSGVEQVTDWLEGPPLRIQVGDIEAGLSRGLDEIQDDPAAALSGTFSVLSTGGGLLAGGLLTLITTLFFMKDRGRMWSAFLSITPVVARGQVDRSGRAAWNVLVGYVQVTLTSAVVDSIIIGVAAGIVGVPVAFALGVLVFLFAFIPTIGAILSGGVVVLVTLVTQGVTQAIIMALIVLAVQQLDANVMYPLLTSRRLSIHPLASLLLVAAGAVVGGLFGAFIAVPVAAMLIAVINVVRAGDVEPEGPEEPDGVNGAQDDPVAELT